MDWIYNPGLCVCPELIGKQTPYKAENSDTVAFVMTRSITLFNRINLIQMLQEILACEKHMAALSANKVFMNTFYSK